MSGFTHEVKGDKLVVTVDLKADQGTSRSGKNLVIATSRGNIDVGDGVKLGLNVYKARID